MNEKKKGKGEITMNASVLKPVLPFVTRKSLNKTPISEQNRKRIEFMDSHNFSFSIDRKTGMVHSQVEKK